VHAAASDSRKMVAFMKSNGRCGNNRAAVANYIG